MTTYFSYYWMAYVAQYKDQTTHELVTKIAPTRLEAITKALQDIYKTN